MKNQDPEPVRMTRRQLAGAILATGATAAAAQTPAPAEELQAAQEQNQRTAEALAKVQVPIESEPAFHFTT
jgi:hypothetical protein